MKCHILINSESPTSATFLTAEGHPIHGVRIATVTLRPNHPATAQVEILSLFTGPAEAEFTIRDPVSGTLKAVDRIQFADGTTFPPHD